MRVPPRTSAGAKHQPANELILTPTQVVLCMIDLKLARLMHDPKHRDSIADVIGYAALMPEVTR